MRRDYTLISVGVAAVVLTLPLAVLAFWPSHQAAEPSSPDEQLADIKSQVEELHEDFSSLSATIEKALKRLDEPRVEKPAAPTAVAPTANEVAVSSTAPPQVNTPPSVAATLPAPVAEPNNDQLAALTEKFDTLTTRLNDLNAQLLLDRLPKEEATDVEAKPTATQPADEKATARETAEASAAVAARAVASAEPTDDRDKKKPTKRPSRSTSSSRTRSSKKPAVAVAAPTEPVSPTATSPTAAITEPVLRLNVTQPREGSVVGRINNMVAYTEEPGWPVVMTRSDIEGDSWWIQQVVARQGNYIAARVNFGNIDTLTGSRFQMVVLLLDTHEEAVRFRTARQFSEIPKGIRHSKVFHYMRQ